MTDEKKISELTADELAAYANDALVAKNRELLAEVKKFKASATGLQTELEAANAELTEIKLTRPVNAMLAQMFAIPSDIAMLCAQKFINFELDGDNIVVRDKEGKALMIKPSEKEAEREAAFDAGDLKYILNQTGELDAVLIGSRATGTGGKGSHVTTIPPKETDFSSQLGVK